MNLQLVFSTKNLPTILTRKDGWLLVVPPYVVVQIFLGGEHLCTQVTRVWFSGGMGLHVSLQTVSAGKLFAAGAALMFDSMSVQLVLVHLACLIVIRGTLKMVTLV